MQEKEWGTCTQPGRMLLFLGGQASGRKLRLFACACVRRVWYLLGDERSWVAVEVTERFADRRARRAELASAGQAAQEVCSGHPRTRPTPGHHDAEAAAVRLASSPTTGRRWAGARYVAEAAVEAVAHGPVWDAAPTTTGMRPAGPCAAPRSGRSAACSAASSATPSGPPASIPPGGRGMWWGWRGPPTTSA